MVVKLPGDYEKHPVGRTIIGNSPDYNQFRSILSKYMSNVSIMKDVGIQTCYASEKLWERQFDRWRGCHWLRKRRNNLNRFRTNLCSKENFIGIKRGFNTQSTMIPKYVRNQFDTPETDDNYIRKKRFTQPVRNTVKTSRYKYREYEPWLVERESTSDSTTTSVEIQPMKYHRSLQENLNGLSKRLRNYKHRISKRDLYSVNTEKTKQDEQYNLENDTIVSNVPNVKNDTIISNVKNVTTDSHINDNDSSESINNKNVIKKLSQRIHNLENATFKNKPSNFKFKMNRIRKFHKYFNKNSKTDKSDTKSKPTETISKPFVSFNAKTESDTHNLLDDSSSYLKPVNISDMNYIPASKFPWLHKYFNIKKEQETLIKSLNETKRNENEHTKKISYARPPFLKNTNKCVESKTVNIKNETRDANGEYQKTTSDVQTGGTIRTHRNDQKNQLIVNGNRTKNIGVDTERESPESTTEKESYESDAKQFRNGIGKELSNRIERLSTQIEKNLLEEIVKKILNEIQIDLLINVNGRNKTEEERFNTNDQNVYRSLNWNNNLAWNPNRREVYGNIDVNDNESFDTSYSSCDDQDLNSLISDVKTNSYNPLVLNKKSPINIDIYSGQNNELKKPDCDLYYSKINPIIEPSVCSPRSEESTYPLSEVNEECRLPSYNVGQPGEYTNMSRTLLDIDVKFNELFSNIQKQYRSPTDESITNHQENRYDVNYITNNIQSFSSQISDLRFLYLNQ